MLTLLQLEYLNATTAALFLFWLGSKLRVPKEADSVEDPYPEHGRAR